MPNPDFLPVAAVAKLLGRDVRTVHRWIEHGKLPAVKAHEGLRAPYLIARADAQAALARQQATGSAA